MSDNYTKSKYESWEVSKLVSHIVTYFLLSDHYNRNTVTIKYFQKGHTFMTADAFHKTVEDEMRSMKYMYDFSDFEKAINAKGRALILSYSDFKNYSKELSKARDSSYPKLENVSVVRFKRGSRKIQWKIEMREWCSSEFAKMSYRKSVMEGKAFI